MDRSQSVAYAHAEIQRAREELQSENHARYRRCRKRTIRAALFP
jgi:hypothetical protein